jgi:hypothetical protein
VSFLRGRSRRSLGHIAELISFPPPDLAPILIGCTALAAINGKELLTVTDPRIVVLWMADIVLLHEMYTSL